jgi:hypothetical protein
MRLAFVYGWAGFRRLDPATAMEKSRFGTEAARGSSRERAKPRRGGKPCDTDSENTRTTPSESGSKFFCGAEVIPGRTPGLFRGPACSPGITSDNLWSRPTDHMTPSKAQRRERLTRRTGIVCSCCMVVFVLCLGSVYVFPDGSAPRWFGVLCGVVVLGGIVSAAICITTAISGAVSREEKQDGVADRVV